MAVLILGPGNTLMRDDGLGPGSRICRKNSGRQVQIAGFR